MRMVFEFHLRVAALSVAVFHACLFAQNTMQGESVTPVADDLAPEVSWPLHSTLAIVDVPNDFAQRCPVPVVKPVRPLSSRYIFVRLLERKYRRGLQPAGGGNAKTCAASMRALRWLKCVQNDDGSWGSRQNALVATGLAMLAYLSLEEMPDETVEFGESARAAVEYLMLQCGRSRTGNLEHDRIGVAIASCAFCKIYPQTRNPNVRAAAKAGLAAIVANQSPLEDWRYDRETTQAHRLAIAGWEAMALHEGAKSKLLGDSVEERHALHTVQARFGSFTNVLELASPYWAGMAPNTADPYMLNTDSTAGRQVFSWFPYFRFFATLKKWEQGAESWRKWFDRLWPSYVTAQFVTPADDVGLNCPCPVCRNSFIDKRLCEPYHGEWDHGVAIGHWIGNGTDPDSLITDTCLAVLQLMISTLPHSTFEWIASPLDAMLWEDIHVDFGI